MPPFLDANAQPNPNFNRAGRMERGLDMMLGLCQGMLADGHLSEAEANHLRDFIRANPDVTETWPGDVVARRLQRIYADGRIDEDERAELQQLLEDLIGGRVGIAVGVNRSTELPLDRPPPAIEFADRVFVLTGTFAFGPRRVCQQFVEERGGRCESGVTKRTDFLVIGTFASRDWKHTNHGRKIEKAIEYQRRGIPLGIVGEDHWAGSLS